MRYKFLIIVEIDDLRESHEEKQWMEYFVSDSGTAEIIEDSLKIFSDWFGLVLGLDTFFNDDFGCDRQERIEQVASIILDVILSHCHDLFWVGFLSRFNEDLGRDENFKWNISISDDYSNIELTFPILITCF